MQASDKETLEIITENLTDLIHEEQGVPNNVKTNAEEVLVLIKSTDKTLEEIKNRASEILDSMAEDQNIMSNIRTFIYHITVLVESLNNNNGNSIASTETNEDI